MFFIFKSNRLIEYIRVFSFYSSGGKLLIKKVAYRLNYS